VRALGLETATWTASVGMIDGRRVLAERSVRVADSHARILLGLIDDVLDDAGLGITDLDLLAVSIGPGSFTGLRIGLSVAKGIALAAGIPVSGVPTLEALARRAGPRRGLVCPVLDARRGEVYGATFRWQDDALVTLTDPVVVAPRRLAEKLEPPCLLLGDAVDVYRDVWVERFGNAAELASLDEIPPSGAVVAALGTERYLRDGPRSAADLEPTYVRRCEAEMNHNRHSHETIVERAKIDRGGVVG
jgi:tRNA threonylcarbamoyladenosine biosynthesis protein TsaB